MARDDDLRDLRAELARELAGLAHALSATGEPLVEAALVDVVREWRRVRDLASPSRWARDRLARHSLRHPSDPLPADPSPLDAVRSLPALPRAALVLAVVDGLDADDVAAALEVTATKAAAALAQARATLADALPEPRSEPEPAPPVAEAASTDLPAGAPRPPADDLFAPPWRTGGAR